MLLGHLVVYVATNSTPETSRRGRFKERSEGTRSNVSCPPILRCGHPDTLPAPVVSQTNIEGSSTKEVSTPNVSELTSRVSLLSTGGLVIFLQVCQAIKQV